MSPPPGSLRAAVTAALAAIAAFAALPVLPVAAQETQAVQTYPAYLAEQLAEDPVYVSDHFAGVLDLSDSRSRITAQVERLEFPMYVIVAPRLTSYGEMLDDGFLAAVHDRLGEDGVYLLLDHSGATNYALAYGVQVPLREATMEATMVPSFDYATPAPDVVERIVDNLAAGPAEAKARYERRQELYRSGADDTGDGYERDGFLAELAAELDPESSAGIRNQGLLIGAVISGLATIAGGALLHRRYRLGSAPTAPRQVRTPPSRPVTSAPSGPGNRSQRRRRAKRGRK
ncbi:hypothetical protein [Nocardiopsis ansamitocini]|uniref:TPM domain-containing protein n=1 Tax=Nocardiopsis ansamitocini TaxID=1670832 RepID=A0A9W6UKB9_9ACTN|nr:hypothetical protein [Nocardiopsis ansamitocini]GLU49577.1 hypothetical protein Nans01_39280 [Nocardiopsis ansamitocini]